MILDVLARGEMALAAAEIVRDIGQRIHLASSQDPARDFGANHMHAGLALRVNAAAEALRAKLVVVDLARCPFFRVRAKDFDILPNGCVVGCFSPGDEVGFRRGEDLGGCHLNDYLYLYRDYYI